MKNCRKKKVGLSTVWIDYQKAYDMVPHLWIRKAMEMCGVANNISHLLSKSMESWQTISMSGYEDLGGKIFREESFRKIPHLFYCL